MQSKWYGKERLRDMDNLLYHKMVLATAFVKSEAKRRCPYDTGNLEKSITDRVTNKNGEIVGEVGTNVEYAIYVEYGTNHGTYRIPAQPYLRPAILENRKQITRFLNDN